MAKPTKKPNGTWTLVVQFANKRRNLTLGKLPKSQVDAMVHDIESLIEHNKYGGKLLPQRLQAWVENLSERHKVQLSELGLFEYRSNDMTIGDLLKKYLVDYEDRPDIAKSTKDKVRSTINNRFHPLLKVRLSAVEPVRKSIRQNAEPIWSNEAKKHLTNFNSWQRNHCAPATWTRDNKLLSSVGIWAVERGICQYSPFTTLPSASMVNDERNHYLTSEMVLDAMEACLSPDIRLTLALGRFAGLRTCSEVRTMKWSHIDQKAGTLTVIDSKKKTSRVMPLFDHVRAELEKQLEFTGDTRFVASSRMRQSASSANYQQIKEAITRSGQEPWDRIRQNLRTSCENDLLDLFDERLVTQWLGHTVSVSRSHYQKLRPSDYQKAIARAAEINPL